MAGSRKAGIAIGFDGGGTKTQCVVLDSAGQVLGQGSAGPSNPLRVGFESAFHEIATAAARALAASRREPREVSAVCAGLAGAGQRKVVRNATIFLSRQFPGAHARVTTDCEVALEAGAGPGPGVVIVAGTGSVAFGRNAAGETAQAGGFGRWIGDEGSAYEMGRRAVASVAHARDHAAPVTLLAEMISAELKCPNWDELIERIATNPDEVFPRIFPQVVAAAEAEDSAAREVLFSGAMGLSSMAMTVVRRLRLRDQDFALVKCGGVFGASPLLEALLDSALSSAAPRARISRLQVSPALGAARMAARLASEPERAKVRRADA